MQNLSSFSTMTIGTRQASSHDNTENNNNDIRNVMECHHSDHDDECNIVVRPVPTHFRSLSNSSSRDDVRKNYSTAGTHPNHNNNNNNNDQEGTHEVTTLKSSFSPLIQFKDDDYNNHNLLSFTSSPFSSADTPQQPKATQLKASSSFSCFSSSNGSLFKPQSSSSSTSSSSPMSSTTIFKTNSKGGSFSIYKSKESKRHLHSSHFFHPYNNNNNVTNDGHTHPSSSYHQHEDQIHSQSSTSSVSLSSSSTIQHNNNRQHYKTTITCTDKSYTPIRASPFEPIVNDKRCGRISPLPIEEYEAWIAKRDYERRLLAQEEEGMEEDVEEYGRVINKDTHYHNAGFDVNVKLQSESLLVVDDGEYNNCHDRFHGRDCTFRPVVTPLGDDDDANNDDDNNNCDHNRHDSERNEDNLILVYPSENCEDEAFGKEDEDNLSYSSASISDYGDEAQMPCNHNNEAHTFRGCTNIKKRNGKEETNVYTIDSKFKRCRTDKCRKEEEEEMNHVK